MTDRSELEQVVCDAVARVMHVDPAGLTMDTRWTEDLRVRSMHAFMITAILEDAANVKIPMSRVLQNQTLGDAVDMLEELPSEQP